MIITLTITTFKRKNLPAHQETTSTGKVRNKFSLLGKLLGFSIHVCYLTFGVDFFSIFCRVEFCKQYCNAHMAAKFLFSGRKDSLFLSLLGNAAVVFAFSIFLLSCFYGERYWEKSPKVGDKNENWRHLLL